MLPNLSKKELILLFVVGGALFMGLVFFGGGGGSSSTSSKGTYQNLEEWEVKRNNEGRIEKILVHRSAERR